LLAAVQRRRGFSTALVQSVQKIAQDWVLAPMLRSSGTLRRPPAPIRLLQSFPALRRIPARVIAMGIRRERITAALTG
jgi:hypothetical protein